MPSSNDWLESVIERKQIGTSVRAIVFNRARDQLLVEKSGFAVGQFVNFIGGGLYLSESFENCLRREMSEETDAEILGMSYRFVVENFISFRGQVAHGLEHYYEVQLDREQIKSREPASEYPWIRVNQLEGTDLRPTVVRDCILDGTWRHVRHLVARSSVV